MERMDTTAERRGRRLARLWTVLYTLLIVTASLYPAHYLLAPSLIRHNWHVFLFLSVRLAFNPNLRGDLITNCLLYLPLGLLAPWILPARPSRRWRALLILAPPLLSLLLESTQTLTTNRSASLGDSMMNTLGYLTGYLLMNLAIVRYRLSPAIFVGQRGSMPRAALARALRQVYLILFILLSLVPYHLSFNPRLIKEKMDPARGVTQARILLDPRSPWDRGRLWAAGMVFAALIPYGFFTQLSRPAERRNSLGRIGLTGLGVATTVEVAQLFVTRRTSDLVQCVAGCLGALSGAGLARLWDYLAAPPEGKPEKNKWRSAPPALALACWTVLLLIIGWWPFHFVRSVHGVIHNLIRRANWLPFSQFIERRDPADWVHLAWETTLFLPLGLLLAAALRPHFGERKRTRLAAALLMALAISVGLELSQSLVANHIVDSTDMLAHLGGMLAGYSLGLILAPPARVQSPET